MQTVDRRHVLASLLAAPFAGLAQTPPPRLEKIVVAGWSKPITEVTPLLVEEDKGFYKAQGIALEYVPGAGSNITKPADLKGRKIGVYSLASGTRQGLQVLLHSAGLSEADVTVVVTGLLNFAPLMQGQVDATAATDTGLLIGRRRGLPEVNVMEVGKVLPMSSDLFVVREEVYQARRAALQRFLRGYADAAAWMIAKPEEAASA